MQWSGISCIGATKYLIARNGLSQGISRSLSEKSIFAKHHTGCTPLASRFLTCYLQPQLLTRVFDRNTRCFLFLSDSRLFQIAIAQLTELNDKLRGIKCLVLHTTKISYRLAGCREENSIVASRRYIDRALQREMILRITFAHFSSATVSVKILKMKLTTSVQHALLGLVVLNGVLAAPASYSGITFPLCYWLS